MEKLLISTCNSRREHYKVSGKMSVPDDQRLPKFECKICLTPFDDKEHIPKILTACGHTLCQTCTVKFWEQGKKKNIACPYCRSVTPLKDAKTLPKNFELLEVLEAHKSELNVEENQEEKASEPGQCAQDASHKALFFCEQCSAEFCEGCFDQVHAFKVFKSHQKLPIAWKPYQLPKCKLHHQKDIEFICLEEGCKIKEKLMCSTCLCHNHEGHFGGLLLDIVTENQNLLKKEFQENKKKCDDIMKVIEDVTLDRESDKKEFQAQVDRIEKHFDNQKILAMQAYAERRRNQ